MAQLSGPHPRLCAPDLSRSPGPHTQAQVPAQGGEWVLGGVPGQVAGHPWVGGEAAGRGLR